MYILSISFIHFLYLRWRAYRTRFCVLGQNLCAGTGLCGLQGASRGLAGSSRSLTWPPVDDGTGDIYGSKVSKTTLGPII